MAGYGKGKRASVKRAAKGRLVMPAKAKPPVKRPANKPGRMK